MTLGKKLQLLRKARGMSQEQLAEVLNVSRQAVSKWELDSTLPDTANVVALSKIFGVTTDYLLVAENEETGHAVFAEEKTGGRINPKMIVGIVTAGIGVLGWAAIYIASRFVEVMIPYTYMDEFGEIWTTLDSSRTDVNFGLFVEEYHLEGLLIVLAAMAIAGAVAALWDKYIGPWFRKLREKANRYIE